MGWDSWARKSKKNAIFVLASTSEDYGDGTQTRSFAYIDDTVDGIFKLMTSKYTQPFNIGKPEEISTLEFVRRIEEATNTEVEIKLMPLPEDDPKVRCPNISKSKELLSWEPKIGLAEGLKNTIPFFRDKLSEPAV